MVQNPTWHHSWIREKMEEDGTEPRPDIIAGYRRRWRRMAQNPDLAS